MHYQFTPGAQRALRAAAGWTSGEDRDELAAPALLLGLLAESECRAAIMLAARQIDVAAVKRRWTELTERSPPESVVLGSTIRLSTDVELALQTACSRLSEYPQPLELATEHVLLGLVAAGDVAAGFEVSIWLRRQGLDPDELEAEIHHLYGHYTGPLTDGEPLQDAISPPIVPSCGEIDSPEDPPPTDARAKPRQVPGLREEGAQTGGHGGEIGTLRAVDAAANRAREGLRVVEDFVRFVLDDRHLTGRCKQLRHDLAAALDRVSGEHRLAARETRVDVGTGLATESERRRGAPAHVVGASFARLQEALRSLEEFGKLIDADMAADIEQIRYRSYTLQRAVEITRTSLERLARARLYVLIDGRESAAEFQQLARSLVEAGVHAIQLRDKRLDDRRLLERARLLRDMTAGSDTLFIVNDRAELAALSHADGVHVGQEDLSVKDARTIVGPEPLIGVSTHTLDQARRAVIDGANYIGIGPTFPSETKQFAEFPGLDLLRKVSAEIRLPAFAIGGITQENLSEVLATGIGRVAMGGAILTAGDSAAAAREILKRMGADLISAVSDIGTG